MCVNRVDLAFEFAGNPNGELLYVPASDCVVDSVLPAWGTVVSGTAFAPERVANLWDAPDKSLGSV